MFIILNGLHRSGTMLLSRLINAFPDTFMVKDGFRLPWYYFRIERHDQFTYPYDFYGRLPARINFDAVVPAMSHLQTILYAEIEAMHFEKKLHAMLTEAVRQCRQGDTYRSVFGSLLSTLYAGSGCMHIGVKNTHMGAYAPSLLETFDDCKWIEIIRDPRAWYCSTKVSHPLDLFRSMKMWKAAVATAWATQQMFPARFLIISYEDLILSRTTVLQRICDFMGIALEVTERWIRTLTLVNNDGSPWYANSSYTKTGEKVFGDQNQRVASDYAVLDTKPVYRWQEKLSWLEKSTLSMLTAHDLKRIQAAIQQSREGV